jgi:hypothetical protein
MFNGNPFNVRCSADEDEVEGRCIKRPSCDTTAQLEIDGHCVYPEAAGTFALDELRVDIVKPAAGVAVPSARPYTLKVSPADRFNLLWRPEDDRLQSSWLRISEASRSEAGSVVVFQVVIDPRGLNDSSRLIETIRFSSANATASNNASVRVKMPELKINAAVVAVPSLSRSRMQLRVANRDVQMGEPVEVPQGANVQLWVYAVDEDGLDIRRGDRTLEFIVSKLESGEGTKLVLANYVPAQSAYYTEVPLPQEAGEYQLRLDKVFGFGLLERNGSTVATASIASPIIFVVDASKSLRQTIVGSICGCLVALSCFAMVRVIKRNRARAKELLLSFLRWEGIIVAEVCLELFDFTGTPLRYPPQILPTLPDDRYGDHSVIRDLGLLAERPIILRFS